MPKKQRRSPTSRKKVQARLQSLTRLARKGDTSAQRELAAFYATDENFGLKNEAEAVKWYTQAAESGDAEAQYNLGLMIVIGEGTEKDLKKGIWWMEKSVKHGYKLAAHVLSIIYREGMYGVKPSRTKAASWNKKAGSFKDRV
jgi:TPR repeat protein